MSDADFAWKLFIIVNSFVSLVAMIIGVYASLRRNPPVAEELYRHYATKDDVRQLRDEFLKTMAEIFDVQRKMKETTDATFMGVQTKLGFVDGMLSRCPGIRECKKLLEGMEHHP